MVERHRKGTRMQSLLTRKGQTLSEESNFDLFASESTLSSVSPSGILLPDGCSSDVGLESRKEDKASWKSSSSSDPGS